MGRPRVDSSRLQGDELLAARFPGRLAIKLEVDGKSIVREVICPAVWNDPAEFHGYLQGLGESVLDRLEVL